MKRVLTIGIIHGTVETVAGLVCRTFVIVYQQSEVL